MVDSKELVELQQSNVNQKEFRIATVTELFNTGTAKIKYRGEDTDSEKEYSYLASYYPSVGDDVLLAPIMDTYIIIGKIMFKEGQIQESFVTTDDLNTLLVDYIKSESLAEYAKKTDLNGYLPVSPNGTINIGNTGYLNKIYDLRVDSYLTVDGYFKHTNGNLGFFGTAPTSKQSVTTLSTSADQATIISKLNTLINILSDYGLV